MSLNPLGGTGLCNDKNVHLPTTSSEQSRLSRRNASTSYGELMSAFQVQRGVRFVLFLEAFTLYLVLGGKHRFFP